MDRPFTWLKWLDNVYQFIGLESVPKITGKQRPDYLIGLFFLAAFILVFLALLVAFKMLLVALGLFSVEVTHSPLSSLGLGALVVALMSAPLVIWRSWVAHKDYKVKEQGHITDRINKAVEGLGAEKTVKQIAEDGTAREFTQPNLEVRIGAIYALERIAQDSLRDHIQIMEILCAYIRENAPASNSNRDKPRTDIQIALTVIGRRSNNQVAIESIKGYRLDLSRVSLQGASIIGTFNKASFSGSNFERALFDGNFDHANFSEAILSEATLSGMKFCNVDFSSSKLGFAKLNGSKFKDIHFKSTDFNSAKLDLAAFQNVSFRLFQETENYNLTQGQIDSMFGDDTVRLPKGLNKPEHWPKEKLGERFDDAYDKWFGDKQWLL